MYLRELNLEFLTPFPQFFKEPMYVHVYVHKDLLQCAFFFLVQLFVSP